jgi:hypothetical protein
LLPKAAEVLEDVSHIGGEEAVVAAHLLSDALQHPRVAGMVGTLFVGIVYARKSAQHQKLSATGSSSSITHHSGLSLTYPGSPYSLVFYQSPMQPADWKQLALDLQKNLLELVARLAVGDANQVADPVGAVISEFHRRRAGNPDKPDQ